MLIQLVDDMLAGGAEKKIEKAVSDSERFW